MNQIDNIQRIIERDFNGKDDAFKALCMTFLESAISTLENQMEYEDSVTLVGSLSSYFQQPDNEEESEEASSSISLPKRSRKPNAFNAFLAERGLATAEGAPIWKSLGDDERKKFQRERKPVEEASTLLQVPEFWRWQNATQILMDRKIHVLAICAHEDLNRRIVNPLAIYNSDAAGHFFDEITAKSQTDLPERLDRLANQQRSDEDHQNCLVNQAKRKGGKLVAKKKYCRPSDKSKKETGTYVREELRRLIGKCLPKEILKTTCVPLARFNSQGYYIKGLMNFKLENWPLGLIKPLRKCSRTEMEILRASLENREIKISRLSQSAPGGP